VNKSVCDYKWEGNMVEIGKGWKRHGLRLKTEK
jgi:hypothetical protein